MKNINFLKASIVIFGLIFVLSVVTYAKNIQENISDSVLRLHIIANSNEKADQDLKLKVRDRLIKEGTDIFERDMSLEETKRFIAENKGKIQKIAEEEIRKNGYSYNVEIKLGKFSFPAKFYDSVMLPSGRYEALRIIIGEGKGENWWCVLYPPMCAIDKVTVEKGKKQLEKSLSGEEYKMISKQNPPAEIRFKIVDIINSIL